MEVSIISSVVESVIVKLGEALILPFFREAIFLRGTGRQVQLLKDELRAMQSFLEDADAKQHADRRVKNWVNDVRAAVYEAEDAIDIFAYNIAPLSRQAGFRFKLKRYAFIFAELKARYDLGKKIKGINVKITEISRRREIYDIQSISPQGEATGSSETYSLRRHPSPHVPEPDFVGLKELDSLIEDLTKREQLRRCSVSLVGMGGLGKTTLAKEAYNHEKVKNCFEFRVWVSVSQQYSVRELLLTIGKKRCSWPIEELERMSAAELSSAIFDSLKDTTYFIVLDDIWERRAWDDLKDAFPDFSNGSRILLTTRNREVALYADARSRPHELPFLKEDESWQLFCKKAFPGQEMGCPLYLESIGREIVKKCQGLPLAIVVMGGLLSTKMPEASEWKKVLDSIHWQFTEGDNQVLEILSLSYNHLPYRMKPCFLYLAALPEDYKFPANKLIQLWVAEGLLPQRGDETPEEVGEDILMELTSRNLIQVAATSSTGLIKSCCIHDLLRDLCVLKAKEEMFLEVHRRSNTSPSVCEGRRLALHGTDAMAFTHSKSPTLQSIFLFVENQKDVLERRQLQILFESFKMLRVLDLHQVLVREVPDEIGKLVHLRYLHCSNTSIESLPRSMANLGNLQTLYMERKQVNGALYIPEPVKNMLQGLRCLRIVTQVESSEHHDAESSEPCNDDCQQLVPHVQSSVQHDGESSELRRDDRWAKMKQRLRHLWHVLHVQSSEHHDAESSELRHDDCWPKMKRMLRHLPLVTHVQSSEHHIAESSELRHDDCWTKMKQRLKHLPLVNHVQSSEHHNPQSSELRHDDCWPKMKRMLRHLPLVTHVQSSEHHIAESSELRHDDCWTKMKQRLKHLPLVNHVQSSEHHNPQPSELRHDDCWPKMKRRLRHLPVVTHVQSSEHHNAESSELHRDDCWQNMKQKLRRLLLVTHVQSSEHHDAESSEFSHNDCWRNMKQRSRHLPLDTHVQSSEHHDSESSELHHDDHQQNLKPYLSRNFLDIIISAFNGTIRYEQRLELEHSHKSSKVYELNLIQERSDITTSSSTSSSMPMPPLLQRPLLTSCHLKLVGYLSKLPDQPCDFPSNLSKLKLSKSNLTRDPLPLLEKLENLRVLILDIDSYVGKEMVCSAIGFPRLQSLYLRQLYNLERWTVGAGAMPCLSDLQIRSCYQLEMLPEGLKYSTKLQTLVIRDLPPKFTNRLLQRVGEDWYKIQHVPSIKMAA